MSDPTPTDVQELAKQLRAIRPHRHDPLCAVMGGYSYPCDCGYADERATIQQAADALTALRLDVQRITEERDRALAQSAAEAKQFQEAAEMAGALAEAEADRDAQVREAFMAGRFGRALPSGWTFTEPEYAHNADEAFAAYLRERQDGKEHAE
jgi:FtsZ-binding cell division protein ZapB